MKNDDRIKCYGNRVFRRSFIVSAIPSRTSERGPQVVPTGCLAGRLKESANVKMVYPSYSLFVSIDKADNRPEASISNNLDKIKVNGFMKINATCMQRHIE